MSKTEKGVAYFGNDKSPTERPTGVIVRFKKLAPGPAPARATDGSAGWDLACVYSEVTIAPHRTAKIRLGIAVEIPPGYEGQFRARSSLASRGLLTVVGTVDSDFRGELCACITNTGNSREPIKIGERIGQLVIHKLPAVSFVEVDELSDTERADGGFGSTGK